MELNVAEVGGRDAAHRSRSFALDAGEAAASRTAPQRQDTSGGATQCPGRQQLPKERYALRSGSGSLERRECRVAKVDRLIRIERQVAERGLYWVDVSELRERHHGVHAQLRGALIGDDL